VHYHVEVRSLVKTSDLRGMDVITSDAFALGEIAGTEVDTKNWRLTHLHIELTDEATRELGFKKPILGHVSLCLPVDRIKAFGDVITLNKDMAGVKEYPECKHM